MHCSGFSCSGLTYIPKPQWNHLNGSVYVSKQPAFNPFPAFHLASDSGVVLVASSLCLTDSWHLDVIKNACVEPIRWQLDSLGDWCIFVPIPAGSPWHCFATALLEISLIWCLQYRNTSVMTQMGSWPLICSFSLNSNGAWIIRDEWRYIHETQVMSFMGLPLFGSAKQPKSMTNNKQSS